MWSWATNKYGGRAALQSLSDILIHGDSGNVSHGSQSSDLRRMFFGVARAQDVLEEILFKKLLRKKYFREIAILLNRFLDRLGPQILHENFLQDLPMVCFVVTQHSESALSLCLRYSKTSCEATRNKIFNENLD